MSCKYKMRGPDTSWCNERVDDLGRVIKGRLQDGRGRRFAEPHAGVVERDDMKPIRQTRNDVVELVRGGETVQQDDGRLRPVPGLAVEEPQGPQRRRS